MLNSIFKKLVLSYLKKLHFGRIKLIDENQQEHYFGKMDQPFAEIKIYQHSFYQSIITRGVIGVAEAYMKADWDCAHLSNLVEICLVNYKSNDLLKFLSAVKAYFTVPLSFFNRNTPVNTKKQIHAHYDLSNDFFQLFLDSHLMYSAAYFAEDHMNLEQASLKKMQRICELMQLSANDQALEIGSGWGGFATYALLNYGCALTTTTISAEQYAYFQRKISANPALKPIKLIQQDYRALKGQYNKIISIEMLEAVGHHYFKRFFSQCDQLLKPEGKLFIQTILINDQTYTEAKYKNDFIKKYIFPGGCLPSLATILQITKSKTALRLIDLKDIGQDYVKTLQAWLNQFESRLAEVRQLGFNESFIRMWRFYLCYCQAGFKTRYITDVQLLFDKPKILI